jgi:hypothetical protein
MKFGAIRENTSESAFSDVGIGWHCSAAAAIPFD